LRRQADREKENQTDTNPNQSHVAHQHQKLIGLRHPKAGKIESGMYKYSQDVHSWGKYR
jgi:hypothetical protein